MQGTAATAYRTKIPTYCCPSDNAGTEGHYDSAYNNGGPGFSRSNVVGCFSADGFFIEPNAPSMRSRLEHLSKCKRDESFRGERKAGTVQLQRGPPTRGRDGWDLEHRGDLGDYRGP